MSSLQSDAARVLYFEKSLLIGGSNDEPLSGEDAVTEFQEGLIANRGGGGGGGAEMDEERKRILEEDRGKWRKNEL